VEGETVKEEGNTRVRLLEKRTVRGESKNMPSGAKEDEADSTAKYRDRN